MKNASLIAKSDARLAAVQLLYRDAMTGGKLSPEKLVAEYKQMRAEGEESIKEARLPKHAPDNALLTQLIAGVKDHRTALTTLITGVLRDDWTLERMGALMEHVLLVAAFELDAKRDRATAVLVDEYTTLANRLLSEDESQFVHAALHRMAAHMRS